MLSVKTSVNGGFALPFVADLWNNENTKMKMQTKAIRKTTICFFLFFFMFIKLNLLDEDIFSDYETMEELFAIMEDDVAALTLWRRVLECIKRLLNALRRHLGISIDEIVESIINDEEAANDYFIMAKALEDSKSA